MLYSHDVKVVITDGPSKLELITALAYAFDREHGPFYVTFCVKLQNPNDATDPKLWRLSPEGKDTPIKAQITGLVNSDETGVLFNIEGYLDFYETTEKPNFHERFTGTYSTKSHKGAATITIWTADDK